MTEKPVLLALAILAFAGSVQLPAQEVAAAEAPAQAPETAGDSSYIIGVGDLLKVSVWKNPDLQAEVPVRPDGRISVPLIGEVHVAGLTPLEVQALLTDHYTRFVTAPSVSVLITQINSRKVFILGQVKESGAFDILQPTNVMQALAMAGGVTEFAKTSKIVVLREVNGVKMRWQVNLDAVASGKRPDDNMVLEPGDTIIVP
jgi:polysaccharide export outer membrane protein